MNEKDLSIPHCEPDPPVEAHQESNAHTLDRVFSRISQISRDTITIGHDFNSGAGHDNSDPLNAVNEVPESPMRPMKLEGDDYFAYHSYPEGGLRAWLVVLGSFLGLIPVFGLINSFGAIQAYLEENQLQDISSSQVSWIFSIFLFLSFLLSIQAGPVFDAYGPYHLCAVGITLYTAFLLATSWCTQYYQFILAFGVLGGIAQSLLWTPYIAVIGHWFSANRGAAIGAATAGGSAGGIIFPVMLRSLYSKVGFPWAIRIVAFFCLVLLMLSLVLIKPRLNRKKFKFNPKSLVDLTALKDLRYLFLVIAVFLLEWSLLCGMTYITSYCIAAGMSQSSSYLMLTIVNTAGVVGRYSAGVIADRFGRFNTFIASCVLTSTVIFAIWLPFGHIYGAMVAFSVLYGLGTGTVMSVTPVCCGQICKTEEYGKRYGTLYSCSSFAPLIGIPISGAMIHGSDYSGMIILSGALYVGALGFLIVSRYFSVGFGMCKF